MKNFFSPQTFFFAIIFTIAFLSVQAQTQYYWNPAGSSTSAKDKNNWRVGSCSAATKAFPSTGGVANFSNCATTNCTIDTTFSVSNIAVTSGYSGTITQSGSNVVTCHKGSFKGGTFTGSSAAITCDSSLTIDGTAFTSTSGTLTTAEFTYKSGTFTHNSGSVIFKKGSTSITTLSSTSNSVSVTFYNAEFSSSIANTVFNVKNINIILSHTMKISGSNDLFLNSNTSSKIEVQGDLTITNGSTTSGGTCLLNFDGTGTQNLTGTTGGSGTGKLCNMKVNKSSGTLNYSNNITLGGSCQFEYTAGTINPGTSMFNCYYNNILKKTSNGEWDFNNLNMMGTGGRDSMIGTITVLGNFSTSHTGD
ncbi:MAG: hypothetical protein LH473_06270 [Chitinophagales bacterium]|nr:hypothetical protein [Chitinophagales bacterium]